jgi:hypothetical protein
MKANIRLPKARLLTAGLLLFSFFFIHQSCTKLDTEKPHLNDAVEKFFTVPAGTKSQVKRVMENLKEQNKLTGFINEIVKKEGYALWNKAMINTRPASYKSSLRNLQSPVDTFIHIPLVLEGTEYVNSFILAKLNGTMTLQLFRGRDYASFGFGDINADTANAEKLALQIMVMTKEIFGHDKYILKDSRLFNTHHGHLPAHAVADRKFKVSFNQSGSSLWFSDDVTTCTYIQEQQCPYTICSGPGGSCDNCVLCVGGDYSCTTSTVWYFIPDVTEGGGGGSGGGVDPIGPQGCNPTPLLANGLPPCPRGNDTGWELEPINDNQIIIDSLQGYPCAQSVLAALPSVNAEVKTILHDVFGVNDDVNMIFVPHTYSTDSLDAEFKSKSFGNYTIWVNTGMLDHATKDYIAATLLHEAIHAYIIYMKYGGGMDSATFAQHFPIYMQYVGNNAQHNEMAANYVSIMKSALMSLNPNLSSYNAEALSWGGLQMTTVWRNRGDSNAIYLRNTVAKRTNIPHFDSTGSSVNYLTYGYLHCP